MGEVGAAHRLGGLGRQADLMAVGVQAGDQIGRQAECFRPIGMNEKGDCSHGVRLFVLGDNLGIQPLFPARTL